MAANTANNKLVTEYLLALIYKQLTYLCRGKLIVQHLCAFENSFILVF